ncbi:sigma-70 family RNA polymerase sigma factor [Variovorax dokdonensis]|uniref:Sigma-70 family RNA polymerase sigma factor n=1 Tax=Variovorax dokdonensis TaxID=344883 RepID=A0ABT7N5A1_9BURK|nr:sigma-70 family RNA polymerase sigma factor [Variovorax dokdonensis]MDM0043095.1 sigma-70 family RNA polymerase sigma factor [Variovorax dokdonensis]
MLEPDAAIAELHEAMPDEALMRAFADGDSRAFDVLYGRHEGALYRFVRRLLGVRLAAEVDEVFQETWFRIVAARESFAPQGARWRTWAFTIAHNLAMDRLRVSGREVVLAHGDDDEEGGDGAEALRAFRRARSAGHGAEAAHPSAEELAFWRAAGRRLLACLDELPDDQRAAFLLRNEEGVAVEDIAQMQEVEFETVRSRLRYGLKKLRACMATYLEALGPRA